MCQKPSLSFIVSITEVATSVDSVVDAKYLFCGSVLFTVGVIRWRNEGNFD